MTPSPSDEREALEWLEWLSTIDGEFKSVRGRHARTLKRMLAERRESTIAECIQAVGMAAWSHQGNDSYSQGMDRGARHQLSAALDALARLSQPRTREVEIERWLLVFHDGYTSRKTFGSEKAAQDEADSLVAKSTVVRLTGKATIAEGERE